MIPMPPATTQMAPTVSQARLRLTPPASSTIAATAGDASRPQRNERRPTMTMANEADLFMGRMRWERWRFESGRTGNEPDFAVPVPFPIGRRLLTGRKQLRIIYGRGSVFSGPCKKRGSHATLLINARSAATAPRAKSIAGTHYGAQLPFRPARSGIFLNQSRRVGLWRKPAKTVQTKKL